MRDRKIKVLGKEEMRLRGEWAAVRRKESFWEMRGEALGIFKLGGCIVILLLYYYFSFLFPLNLNSAFQKYSRIY